MFQLAIYNLIYSNYLSFSLVLVLFRSYKNKKSTNICPYIILVHCYLLNLIEILNKFRPITAINKKIDT